MVYMSAKMAANGI